MHVVGVVSLVDVRIGLVRHRFTEKLAQRLPAVTEVMLEQPLFWHHLPHVCVVVDEALPQCSSILPVPSAVIAQNEYQCVCINAKPLEGITLVQWRKERLGDRLLTGRVLLSQRHAGHSRTLKREFSTDLIHESRSLFVRMTLALGYNVSSSSVKLTQGASVVAYKIF